MISQTTSRSSIALVSSRWDALFEGASRSLLEKALPAYITSRRWYRTKTKRVHDARIVAAFPLIYGEEVARIMLVELTLEDGARETYVLPLAFVYGEEAQAVRLRQMQAVVLPLRVSGREGLVNHETRAPEARAGLVVDALVVERVLSQLLSSMARGVTIEDSGARLHFHGLPGIDDSVGQVGSARLVDREQTNTSVFFGERYVGKVMRKLDEGESADVEVGRLLTEVGYAHTPALVGWIDVRRGDGPLATVGLLHAFVPNRGDAWEHVLGILGPWLESASHRDATPPRLEAADVLARAAHPLPLDVAREIGPYADLAERLGRRVGEMHVALASRSDDPSFAPEPLDHATCEAIGVAARADLGRALDGLGVRGGTLTDSARQALAAVRSRVRTADARLAEAARLPEAGVKMRVHGDLHLGQVLFTGADFVLIDFEGEPARPLAERKAKRSPLVDVAGMLRSFHYASVAALRARPATSRDALEPWASLWYRATSASFLRGWLAAVQGSVALPPDPATTRALLDLFLLEKCIYEVGYEMNNRPEWVDIPLEGLREILSSSVPSAPTLSPVPVPVSVPDLLPPSRITPSLLDPLSPALTAFAHGTATHAYALLGAHPHEDGATDFAVWAPHASSVAVVGAFNDWTAAPLGTLVASPLGTLARLGTTGIFAGRIEGARPGQLYKYRIAPGSGAAPFDKADPFGVASELSPGTASVVASLAYAWRDDAWMENRVQGARMDRAMSIYEVHLGSWRRNVEEGARPLSYREIAAPLAAHAKAMGFTHVELMPLLEHPFYGSWGYGVTGFFAATSRYGTPTDLMSLVDTLHEAGLGVIFDWVPAHFARDAHGLVRFDGAPLFEPEDPSRAVHPTWGTGVFDFARPEVRSFLLSSATFWIETFHADGLRVDGVESILYEDHHSGTVDDAGVAFLRTLTGALKAEHPEVILAAEDSSSWPGVTRAASLGGLGFDLKWDMGFAHDMRRYLGIDPSQRSHHQGMLTFRSVYAASESFVLPLSHDDVIEGRGGALLEQMAGDPWQKLANLRLLYAMTWAQPGKKLLFMGDELAQPSAWHHDRSLDWHVAGQARHDGVARMVGDLNRLYRKVPALHVGDATPDGFEWIDGSNTEMSVLVFARRGRGDDDVVVVACNFTPVPRYPYRIGVPRGGHWKEIFNSDARIYGGSGHGNLGGVDAVPYPWNGRPSSVVVTLPPLGAIFLARG